MSVLATNGIIGWCCLLLTACSLSDLVGEATVSETAIGPEGVSTVEGALQLYKGILDLEATALASYVPLSGLLSDELRGGVTSVGGGRLAPQFPYFDQRNLVENMQSTNLYTTLHSARIAAQQGRDILRAFPILPEALRGRLYMVEGLMQIFLAEVFCSGIPLSRLDRAGGIVLAPGSSREEVFLRAIILLDSAIALSSDSSHAQQFASVLKARALLNLGRYTEAALAVQPVDDAFTFSVSYAGRTNGAEGGNGFQRNATTGRNPNWVVGDREGGNGLPYVSSGDLRSDTASGVMPQAGAPYPEYVPRKYRDFGGETPIVVASGIEARLIEAEAALHDNDVHTMLQILNRLRTTCSPDGPCAIPAPAGSGQIAGLQPLHDPATPAPPTGKTVAGARADLLFEERAYWLFLTGHRQGDLRRLIRQYERTDDTVYPVGEYPWSTDYGQAYGRDVTLPVPSSERSYNRSYQGCIDREA